MQILGKYKWIIAVAAVGVFLFYWYEIRPVRLYRSCSAQASADARKLLSSKAEIAKGTDKGAAYEELIKKNMYLRSDYESFLNKCLLYYGLAGTQSDQGTVTSSAASSK